MLHFFDPTLSDTANTAYIQTSLETTGLKNDSLLSSLISLSTSETFWSMSSLTSTLDSNNWQRNEKIMSCERLFSLISLMETYSVNNRRRTTLKNSILAFLSTSSERSTSIRLSNLTSLNCKYFPVSSGWDRDLNFFLFILFKIFKFDFCFFSLISNLLYIYLTIYFQDQIEKWCLFATMTIVYLCLKFMQLFHIDADKVCVKWNKIELFSIPELLSQLRKVLRIKKWDKIYIQISDDKWTTRYEISIQNWSDKDLTGEIISNQKFSFTKKNISMLIAMPNKREKAELITQKLTEIWIQNIYFWISEHSIIRQRNNKKSERLNKISHEFFLHRYGIIAFIIIMILILIVSSIQH